MTKEESPTLRAALAGVEEEEERGGGGGLEVGALSIVAQGRVKGRGRNRGGEGGEAV